MYNYKSSRTVLQLILICSSLLTGGCTHTNKPWGSTSGIAPGWQAIGEAAKNAIADPHTWIPLIGAGVFHAGGLDDNLTEWAVDKDLMFDSTQAAGDYSDDWMEASKWMVYATALATPSGTKAEEWIYNKAWGLGTTFSILLVGDELVSGVKKISIRERPDGTNDKSFPSGHAMRTSFRATLAARNIERMPLNKNAKRALQGAAYGLAGITAWVRMEANKHYPSDVLFGYSLGHFFGAFLNDAFITPENRKRVRLSTAASSSGWHLGIEGTFD